MVKKEYEIRLGKTKLPVLPENLKEAYQMDNKRYNMFSVGERVLPGREKLHTWTISSYFPFGGEISPSEYKEYYISLTHKVDNTLPKPIQFYVVRFNEDGTAMLPVNADVLFESIGWEDRKGEPGDIYYTFKLVEYKEFESDVV